MSNMKNNSTENDKKRDYLFQNLQLQKNSLKSCLIKKPIINIFQITKNKSNCFLIS